MSKKIVAIGGGFIGEIGDNGIKHPYETEIFDREIIRLSNVSYPHVLFIGFADVNYSNIYFKLIDEVFKKRYGCECKHLRFEDLFDIKKVNEYFKWADVFYVGGGNTYTLMKILNEFGINELLKEAYEDGKVMSGLSAGGICWFKYGNTIIPPNPTLIKLKCLGLENMVFAPHCDERNGHFENVENLLYDENMVGISLSNCCAIEIIDDRYRVIAADGERYNIKPFGIKSFWYNDQYYTENIEISSEFKLFSDLLLRKPQNSEVSESVKKLLKSRKIYY